MSDLTREEAISMLERLRFPEPWEPKLSKGAEEALDMAISDLSEELSEDGTLTVHVSDGSKVTRVFVMGDNIFGGLYYPDSAKTDTAKPEEGAELIDRRQIKWYGCDHEGHIKGINCDTADCSKCFFATVEHDEVMSLPVYRIPDSALKPTCKIDESNFSMEQYKIDLQSAYDCGKAKALKGFEGTNGEVLKALFPNMKVHEYTEKVVLNGLGDEFQIQSMAWKNWWNAPYKGESE